MPSLATIIGCFALLVIVSFFVPEGTQHGGMFLALRWVVYGPLLFFAGLMVVWLGFKIWPFFARERIRQEDAKREHKADQQRREIGIARARQLREMRDSLPTSPPDRMRATIRVNEVVTLALMRKEGSYKEFEHVDFTAFAVDMILELSEKDRGVIREQEMENVVIGKVPRYIKAEILDLIGRREQTHAALTRVGTFDDDVAAQVMENNPRTMDSYAAETREVTLGEFFQSHYMRLFDSKPEANAYADKLKSDILPQIRKMLDANAARNTSETVEL